MSDPQSPLHSYFTSAQTILVVLSAGATHEQLAVASALSITLQAQGKDARLVAPQLPASTNALTGLDQIKTELGHQNLLVSFDYSEEKVDKISYHIGEETGKFFLTIKPKKGTAPLDANSVEFAYAGLETDLIVLVGVESLESLQQLYIGYEEVYENTAKVEIDDIGQGLSSVQIVQGAASCLSEAVAHELKAMGMSLPPEAASNLLVGIEEATGGLRSSLVQASTFDAMAWLMRQGGVRPTDLSTTSTTGKGKNGQSKSSGGIGSLDAQNEATVDVIRSRSSTASAISSKPKKPKETEMKVEVRRAK